MIVSILSLLALTLMQQHVFTAREVEEFLMFEKVSYVWGDVTVEFVNQLDVNVTKINDTLIIDDELPAPRNVVESLDDYFRFIRQYYNSSDVLVGLYSSDGSEITNFSCFGKKKCSDDEVAFHIIPYNISYVYPDWNKRFLDIECDKKDCNISVVDQLNISINFTNTNFTCNPAIYNNCTKNDIQWNSFDKIFSCKKKDAGCITYNLTVRDASGQVYSCQGVHGDDKGDTKEVNCDSDVLHWYDGDEAVLNFKINPCNIKLHFGKSRFRVEGKDASNNDCDANMTISTVFDFDSSSFSTDFISELQVRDAYRNYSVEQDVTTG